MQELVKLVCVCVRVCVFVVASHLSAEPAAILLPSVDQEHLSRFWQMGTDVRKTALAT